MLYAVPWFVLATWVASPQARASVGKLIASVFWGVVATVVFFFALSLSTAATPIKFIGLAVAYILGTAVAVSPFIALWRLAKRLFGKADKTPASPSATLRAVTGSMTRLDEAGDAARGKWNNLSGPSTTVEQVYAHGPEGMWSRLCLATGERVMVSQTSNDTKLLRLNRAGLGPKETLGSVQTLELVSRYSLWVPMSPEERSTEILTRLTREMAQCGSLDEMRVVFDGLSKS